MPRREICLRDQFTRNFSDIDNYLVSDHSQGHAARGSPQMLNLASSLIYQQLFQQKENGEKIHEGSAAEKAVTYDLGVKGIPDDVVWALSAVNLDQYDVPQWKITLNKGGVNLNMSWKQPDDVPKSEIVTPREDDELSKPSVIKKINFPVGKLLNTSEPSPVPYLQRVPQMQSILSLRPDQFHRVASSHDQRCSVITSSSVENGAEDAHHSGEPIKANSVESPPQREKSDEELEHHSNEMKTEAMDVDKNTAGLIGNKRYLSAEASDISGNDELQIDESEGDIDVTDGDAPNRNEWANQEEPPRRKSPIEMLLEHRAQQIQSAQGSQAAVGQNGQTPPAFQAMGLQGLYGNPLFHQNLRNQVLQNRGLTPQTLPLLLPNTANGVMSSSPKPNPFLTTNSLDALKNVQRSAMISPVGRSPVPGMNVNQNRAPSDGKGSKDKGPFACSLCGRTFSLRGNLLRHERIHRGDKPFRCRFCNKAFIQRTDVMAHERVHTGEKPFACQYCGKRFPRRSTMKEHEKSFCRARSNSFDGKKENGMELGNEETHCCTDSDEKESRLPFPDKALANSSGTSSGNSSEGNCSKTPSPEHPSQMSESKIPDASDFSVNAVVAQ
ncbi:Oidioi.mRNA.OKI2018_I69.chr2.g6679.t1.cds [Oikopleura dioica]|uniref:Oidioi.mRNA.OKI2018_I69.chr2.g6679.t1.cds n=1 Tax=Oikopleura dioica TaxID=34765 RepID=A0ABN7T8K2_OIKDI|nr:Oidioi.mRNA.OKI2018_I69.chr2.g6679.t1.cds [Oikopleura dioica]